MPKRKTRNKKSLFQPSHLKDDRKKRESASKEYTMQRRIPTVGSTPVDYHIPPILLHLFRHIETMADATLSALRNVDQFNERYFDQTIDSICLLACLLYTSSSTDFLMKNACKKAKNEYNKNSKR